MVISHVSLFDQFLSKNLWIRTKLMWGVMDELQLDILPEEMQKISFPVIWQGVPCFQQNLSQMEYTM